MDLRIINASGTTDMAGVGTAQETKLALKLIMLSHFSTKTDPIASILS